MYNQLIGLSIIIVKRVGLGTAIAGKSEGNYVVSSRWKEHATKDRTIIRVRPLADVPGSRVWHAACPIRIGRNTMARIEKILFPTDFSDASSAAIPWVARIGAITPSEVFIVHVLREQPEEVPDPNYHYQVPEYARLVRADAEKRLHELSSRFPSDIKTHELLLNGDAAEEILKAVKDHEINLIVMATRGETGWRSLLFGSVAEKVIKSADCPVLSIRKPD